MLRIAFLALFFFSSVPSSVAIAAGAAAMAPVPAPTVTKVEPPNWWAGHSINPVRLLVRGSGLQGATVSVRNNEFQTGRIMTNAAGTYLFFDLLIPQTAKPGAVQIEVTTASGTASIPFSLADRLSPQQRFQGFNTKDVIYLIMPDRFANGDASNDDPANARGLFDRKKARFYHGGDLQGIREHLPYLKQLGVTAIWLNPWYDNSNRIDPALKADGEALTDYHGYGAVDFYGVDEHLGTLSTLKQLVDDAHAMGIKVIQDQVANHTGPHHPWVADSPTPTWFNGTARQHLNETFQFWATVDPHAAPSMTRPVFDGWFVNLLPDLNQNDPETRCYLIQNTLWWIETLGLDAIRQDTLPYVPRDFWAEWSTAIHREYPAVNIVGEVLDPSHPDPSLTAYYQGGRAQADGVDSRIDSLFDYPLHFALRRVFAKNEPMTQLASLFSQDYFYPNAGALVTLLGSHDVDRFMHTPGATLDSLKLAFFCLFTSRGTPLIYSGDEIAMPGGEDPDNRRDFPGGWREDARSAFAEAGRTPDEKLIWNWVQQLAAFRAKSPVLQDGITSTLAVSDQMWIYQRVLGSQRAIIAINNGDAPRELEYTTEQQGEWHSSFGAKATLRMQSGSASVKLPAKSASIFLTSRP